MWLRSLKGSLFIVLFFSSVSYSFDGYLFDSNLFHVNGGSCFAELPERILVSSEGGGVYAMLNTQRCFGDNNDYHDVYQSYIVAGCDDAASFKLVAPATSTSNPGCWPNEPGYPGTVTAGYCCQYGSVLPTCVAGTGAYTCQDVIDYNTSNYYTENMSSSLRYDTKFFLGDAVYVYGSNRYVYRLYAEDYCNDDVYIKRSNDDHTIQNLNNELYQVAYTYRGYEYLENIGTELFLLRDSDGVYVHKAILGGQFTRDDITAYGNGKFKFSTTIPGTQCVYNDYRFVAKPEFWFYCLGDYPWVQDNAFGYDFYSSDYDWYNANNFTEWQVWRYAVDEFFSPVGLLEIVKDHNVNFPRGYGYISSPGGYDTENDINLEKGYKYRFRSEADGFLFTYDFSGWPCMGVENGQGLGSIVKGVGSNTKGIGVVNTGVGGFEKRTR